MCSLQHTAAVSSGRDAKWTVSGFPLGSNGAAEELSSIAASPSSTLPVPPSVSAAARGGATREFEFVGREAG